MNINKRTRITNHRVYRVLTEFLAAFILLTTIIPVFAVDTYTAEKPHTTRDIAIVFDNSGSMYLSGNTAWCRAIYAMEVFASMLNEGDTLKIYPMWEIETGGSTFSRETPLSITGGINDPSVIRNIYTPDAGGTPIETIDDAFRGLQSSTADEQWLIVLTDGARFHKNDEEMTDSETVSELSRVLTEYNDQVHVMYLGIGTDAALPSISGSLSSEVEKADDSGDVLDKLTTMGNNIFGRDAIPDVQQNGTISFDVSMSKLILFVQGDNISGVSLKQENGTDCPASSMFSPNYGTRGAGDEAGKYTGYYPMDTADTALSGTIVTYTDLNAGDYTLSCSGNVSNVSAYYEPDVQLAVSLQDENGQVLSEDSELSPGTYYLSYSLVDKNGDPTSSDLLGNVKYEFDCNISGEVQHISAQESGRTALELSGGDSLTVEGDVEYLSGYKVHISNGDVAGMTDPFVIPKRDLYVEISGGADSYQLSQLEQQAVYRVTLSSDEGPISGSDLSRAQVTLSVPGLDYTCVLNGDGFDITLAYPNGNAAETACQAYTLQASAAYTNAEGVSMTGTSDTQTFSIEDDTYGLQLNVDVQQREYILSKLSSAKPILLTLSEDGSPLDDEALENVALQLTVTDKKGNVLDWADAFTVSIVPGQSQYQLQLNKGTNVGTGKYYVSCTASTVNNIGQTISGSDEGKVTIRRIPLWIPILIFCLLAALLAFLIWKFFDMKVLPKDISYSEASYTLDGDKKPGHVTASYSRQSAKQGTIDIATSHHPMYKGVNGRITLSVVAVSPRRVKSAKRKILVTEVTGERRVTRVKLGGTSLNRDDSGAYVPAHRKNAGALSITMQSNSACDFSVSGVTTSGEEVSGPAKLKLVFK